MAKKYVTKSGSYEITRSAKAYDADKDAKAKEDSGTGGKRQHLETKSKLNLSSAASSLFNQDEIEKLKSHSGEKTVSTGGGDPFPKGSHDNEFIVAKDKEEAAEIREKVGDDVDIRVEQKKDPETGRFLENDSKLDTPKKMKKTKNQMMKTKKKVKTFLILLKF